MSIYDKSSLVLIPSGTKTGKVFSQKPVSGDGDFTFTRASAATRVNADGNIEKETENKLLQSNSFDTTWNNVNVTLTSGQAGYDGSSDAWLLSKGAAAFTNLIQSVTTSGINTFSLYAKSGTLSQLTLRDSATNIYARFDLSAGTLITTSGSPVSTSIEDIGGGWYRCSITMSMSSASLQIYPDWNQTNAGNILIQDAQLEQGLVARDYIETTTAAVYGGITDNTPRLDYTDSSCPALLLEPQRTNLYNSSEYDCFDSGGTRMEATGNETAFCDAYDTPVPAAKVQNSGSLYFYDTTSPSATTAHTWSAFFRLPDTNNLGASRIRVNTINTFASSETRFDLVNGTILTTSAEDATITSFPNNWYRLSVTETATSTVGGFNFLVYVQDSLGNDLGADAGDVGDDVIHTFGWQFEEGSYATSYIPTYGSSVTRTADFESNNDLVDTAISFGANDDFTLFYEGSFNDLSSTSNMIIGGGRQQIGASYKNYWWVQNATSMRIKGDAEVRLATTSMSLSDNTNHKLLVKRSGSVVDFFVDGSKLTTTQNNPNTAFTFRSLGWAYTNSVYKVSGNLKQALVFNQALTDQEAIDLTTI
jgi:hypothetical protein